MRKVKYYVVRVKGEKPSGEWDVSNTLEEVYETWPEYFTRIMMNTLKLIGM